MSSREKQPMTWWRHRLIISSNLNLILKFFRSNLTNHVIVLSIFTALVKTNVIRLQKIWICRTVNILAIRVPEREISKNLENKEEISNFYCFSPYSREETYVNGIRQKIRRYSHNLVHARQKSQKSQSFSV